MFDANITAICSCWEVNVELLCHFVYFHKRLMWKCTLRSLPTAIITYLTDSSEHLRTYGHCCISEVANLANKCMRIGVACEHGILVWVKKTNRGHGELTFCVLFKGECMYMSAVFQLTLMRCTSICWRCTAEHLSICFCSRGFWCKTAYGIENYRQQQWEHAGQVGGGGVILTLEIEGGSNFIGFSEKVVHSSGVALDALLMVCWYLALLELAFNLSNRVSFLGVKLVFWAVHSKAAWDQQPHTAPCMGCWQSLAYTVKFVHFYSAQGVAWIVNVNNSCRLHLQVVSNCSEARHFWLCIISAVALGLGYYSCLIFLEC